LDFFEKTVRFPENKYQLDFKEKILLPLPYAHFWPSKKLLGVASSSRPTPLWILCQSQAALMRMELIQLGDVCVEEASRPLREEVAALKLLLTRVSVSLELVGTCPSDGLRLVNPRALAALVSYVQMSSVVQVVEKQHLYGYFSPRGQSSLPDVLASSERKGMYMIVAEMLDLEKGGNVDAPVSLSPRSGMQVVPVGDGVAEPGVLTPMPGAFIEGDLCFSCHLGCCLPCV
jgi:hypothetical protein